MTDQELKERQRKIMWYCLMTLLLLITDFYLLSVIGELISLPSDSAVSAGVVLLIIGLILNFFFFQTLYFKLKNK
jgi:hypothetical protein